MDKWSLCTCAESPILPVCPFISPFVNWFVLSSVHTSFHPSVCPSHFTFCFVFVFVFCSLWAHSPCQNNQGTSNMAPAHPPLIEVVLVYPAFVGHRTRPSGPQVSTLRPDFVPQSLSCSASNPQLCLQELKLALQTWNQLQASNMPFQLQVCLPRPWICSIGLESSLYTMNSSL